MENSFYRWKVLKLPSLNINWSSRCLTWWNFTEWPKSLILSKNKSTGSDVFLEKKTIFIVIKINFKILHHRWPDLYFWTENDSMKTYESLPLFKWRIIFFSLKKTCFYLTKNKAEWPRYFYFYFFFNFLIRKFSQKSKKVNRHLSQ